MSLIGLLDARKLAENLIGVIQCNQFKDCATKLCLNNNNRSYIHVDAVGSNPIFIPLLRINNTFYIVVQS